MKQPILLSVILLLTNCLFSQKEVATTSELKKVTVFFTGAQLLHEQKVNLNSGKQTVVFQQLTDFLDQNTVQVKAQGDLSILSVRSRKNFEDVKISSEEVKKLNEKRKELELKEQTLRDEFTILELDKNLLMRNRDLKGSQQGVKINELKEAYSFMHQKLSEITNRQSEIEKELEKIIKAINQIEQEIISQRSKPVINYTEIVVEVDVNKSQAATFQFQYVTPNATWVPYYDLRSEGIGRPIRLEARAHVSQTTGMDWKNVELVLSTNDPYQNSQEPTLSPWYIYYNNQPYQYQAPNPRPTVNQDFSGQKIKGEAIDATTGEALPFARITFAGNPNVGAVTDFDGKFELIVPKGETQVRATFIGYKDVTLAITGPYLKFFLQPNVVQLESVVVTAGNTRNQNYTWDGDGQGGGAARGTYDLEEATYGIKSKSRKNLFDERTIQSGKYDKQQKTFTNITKRDLRMEYIILAKMTIPTDGMDHRVNIATFDLAASYEYHTAPKIDPAIYLSAQVSGWEKLNLLSGESNIYFDGTFIGKSFLDVNSTKDTLSISLGKDNKISIERTRIKDRSKSKTIGSRQKVEVAWEIKVKNNGGANIPLIIKDQMPVSNNADIKVKYGETSGGAVEDLTKIITWTFPTGITGTKTLTFDYSVDYQSGAALFLE